MQTEITLSPTFWSEVVPALFYRIGPVKEMSVDSNAHGTIEKDLAPAIAALRKGVREQGALSKELLAALSTKIRPLAVWGREE